MTRVEDWAAKLNAVVLAYEHKPFAFGKSDCACFAADCVKAITGVDALARYRGIYGSRLGASARMRHRGFKRVRDAAAKELTDLGAIEIDPRASRVGDIGCTADDVLAVRMPAGFIARNPSAEFVIVQPAVAWAVGMM